MVAWARDEILKLLHPFMPFITEELWAVTAKRDGLLALAPWPLQAGLRRRRSSSRCSRDAGRPMPLVSPVLALPIFDHAEFSDPAAEAEIGWVIDLVTAIRSVRAEMNIPPATLTPLVLAGASAETKARAPRWSDVIKRMARLSDISFADRAPDGAVQLLVRGEVAALPLKGVIDVAAEQARLDKEIAQGRRRHQARRRQAGQREIRRQRAGRDRRGGEAKSARPRSPARPRCSRRWSG